MAKKRLSKSSLLWFIRSRSYVTIPDVRRRFHLDEGDSVATVRGPDGNAYVGLPPDFARLIQDLWRERKIGFEYAMDVHAKAVRGVYVVPHPYERNGRNGQHPLPADLDDDEGDASALEDDEYSAVNEQAERH